LIVWTAFASVFSLLLGYSRVPYAAALDGNYFAVFSKIHPKHKFPHVALVVLGVVALAFCFLSLADVIAALVVIRILLQFLLQAIGAIILRKRRPDLDPAELVAADWPTLHRRLDDYIAAGLTKFVIRPAGGTPIIDFLEAFVTELVPRQN